MKIILHKPNVGLLTSGLKAKSLCTVEAFAECRTPVECRTLTFKKLLEKYFSARSESFAHLFVDSVGHALSYYYHTIMKLAHFEFFRRITLRCSTF